MASTKEIKDRINSVRETRKITNAMYLIASTKLRKAKLELTNTRPYFEALRGEVNRAFRTVEDVDTPYFYPADDDTPREGTYGCLVITADKGLAGSYNMNIIKKAEQMLEKHPDTKLFVVGEYGRHFFDHHSIPIEQSFLYTAQNPTLDRAREISERLLDGFLSGERRRSMSSIRIWRQPLSRGEGDAASAAAPQPISPRPTAARSPPRSSSPRRCRWCSTTSCTAASRALSTAPWSTASAASRMRA